jgi:hypothetical protein
MFVILSGEGSTDIGQNSMSEHGVRFDPGPMARILDRLIEDHIGYSLLDTQDCGGKCVRLVEEPELIACGKQGPRLLPGIKYGKETGFFTRNAQVLGILAKAECEKSGQPVVAVLFRDADGSRATPPTIWQQKVDSIKRGFKLVGFDNGVPMVPRPKSEAWLLCALKNNPYVGCDALEDSPGNDASPNSLKRRLEELTRGETSAQEQSRWVEEGKVDPKRIEMPSFAAFRDALDSAVKNALRD